MATVYDSGHHQWYLQQLTLLNEERKERLNSTRLPKKLDSTRSKTTKSTSQGTGKELVCFCWGNVLSLSIE